jgi:DNA-binding response OmpR family regulator
MERCDGFPLALILDDDPVFRTALASYLLNCGAPVVGAANVREGMAALEHKPGYMVLDLVVGDGSTAVVLAEARRRGLAPVAVVLATAEEQMDHIKEMGLAQPDHTIVRPVAAQVVVEWMVAHFKARQIDR